MLGTDVSNLWGYTPTTLPAALQADSAELKCRRRGAIADRRRAGPDRSRAQRARTGAAGRRRPIAREQSEADALAARALATPAWQFVGALWSPLTAFLASPPGTSFDGIDGGLLGDALARDGERVIVNSVFLSLTLSDALQLTEQTDFLSTLLTRTMVGYHSGGSIAGTPRGLPPTTDVPEPPISAKLVFHVPMALVRAASCMLQTTMPVACPTSLHNSSAR